MRKRASQFEWHMAASDTDWERLQASPRPDDQPADDLRRHLQRYVWDVAALLLLLAGGWLWHSPQAKVEVPAMVKPERQAAVPALVPLSASPRDDLIEAGWWLQQAQAVRGLCAAIQTANPASHLDVPWHTAQFQGDQAVACLVTTTQNGAVAYRQTHFYRWTKEGWLPTAPDARLWGPARSLETPSFAFHFRQNDAVVVIAVAPQIEALYNTMRRNFGLPISLVGSPLPAMFGGDKLFIEVSVTQPPGQATPWFVVPDRFIVPSPAVYQAPVELTDADLLAQSIVPPLLAQVLAQARERYAIGQPWQSLLDGLSLWQVWDLDLPLASWREEVVQWLYGNWPATRPGQSVLLPAHHRELCAVHRLWLRSPTQIGIPLLCADLDWEAWYSASLGLRDPLIRLDQLAIPVPSAASLGPLNSSYVPHLGQTVALATLIEYAVVTYGRERLPALVAGLGQSESWDTLIPAVYGVSPAEFEAGWQAYLAERYAVSLP